MRTVLFFALALSTLAATPAAAGPNPDGSFTHRIPIQVPKGPGAVTPDLALVYNSSLRRGLAGRGWTIDGIPVIQRAPFTQPVRYTADDAIVGPHGRLFYLGGGNYHGQNDELALYRPWGNCAGSPCSWQLTDRRGNRLSFGYTDDSRIEAVGKGGAVRVWALNKIEDTHGNALEVQYDEDTAGGDYYPRLIRYAVRAGISRQRTVRFVWEARPDHVPLYDQGALVEEDRRLKEIEIASDGQLVRRILLGYDAYGRLSSVQEVGDDNQTTLPAQIITWAENKPFVYSTADGAWSDYRNWSDAGQWAGDFNGDGKIDLLSKANGDNLYLRLAQVAPSGDLDYAELHKPMPPNSWGRRELTAVGDFDGDGRDDLVSLQPCDNQCGYTPAHMYFGQSGGLKAGWWMVPASAPSSWNDDGYFWVGDFDGDGKSDLASRTSGAITIARSTGTDFQRWFWAGPPTWGGAQFTWVGDFDGDGRSDIATLSGTDLYVMRSTGASFDVQHYYTTAFGTGLDAKRTFFADFNGDGKSDLATVRNVDSRTSKLILYLSTGSGLAPASTTLTENAWGDLNFPGDFDGDGQPDLLSVNIGSGWTSGGGITATAALRTLEGTQFRTRFLHGITLNKDARLVTVGDVNGDGQPDLVSAIPKLGGDWINTISIVPMPTRLHRITGIANGLGGTIELEWTGLRRHLGAINHNAICGGGLGPECGIPDLSGRPLLTRMITAADASNRYATTYSYANGRILMASPGRHARLGFQTVTARDEATGVYTQVAYYQKKPFAGYGTSRSVYVVGGQIDPVRLPIVTTVSDVPTQVTCTESGCVPDASADPDKPRQIRPGRSVTSHYEMGKLLYAVTRVPDYDTYGNVVALTEWAKDAGGNTLYEERRLTKFINVLNSARAIGLPYETKLCSDGPCADPIEWTRTYYDNLGLGYSDTRLLPTRTETWVGGTTFAATTYGYDVYGNRISETGPDAQTRSWGYDEPFRSELVMASDPVAGVTYYVPDARYGLASLATHESGRREVKELDNFGRPFRVTLERASTVPGAPGTPYRITEHEMPTGPGNANVTRRCDRIDADGNPANGLESQLCTRTWADGLGRQVRTETPSDSGIARVRVLYDAAGRESRVSEPHLPGATIYDTSKEYDAFGRPTKVTHPDGTVESFRYNDVTPAPGAVTVEVAVDGRNLTSQRHKDAKGRVVRIVEGIGQFCLPDITVGGGGVVVATQGTSEPTQPATTAPATTVGTLTTAPVATTTVATAPATTVSTGTVTTKKESATVVAPTTGVLAPDRAAPRPLRCRPTGGVITDYTYDYKGRLRTVKGPDGITLTITYDAAGRRESVTHPSAGTTRWTYYTTPGTPSFGKVRTEERPDPNAPGGTQLSTWTYDAKGRPLMRADSDGSQLSFTYDETDVPNGKGRVTTTRLVTGGYVVVERYGFDLEGRAVELRRTVTTADGQPLADARSTRTYDELGRVKHIGFPDGTTLTRTYKASSGSLDSISIGKQVYARYPEWDLRGKLRRTELGNGVVASYGYTPVAGALESLSAKKGATTLLDYRYEFDPDDNVRRIVDQVLPGLSTTFNYDGLNRLVRAARDDGKVFDYALSAGGLLVGFSDFDVAGQVVTRTRTVDAATGRLADDGLAPIVYGASGAIRQLGSRAFEYDGRQLLTVVREGGRVVEENLFGWDHSRVLRIEHGADGSDVWTWTLGEGYEVSERRSGGAVLERRGTRIVIGPDGARVATVTTTLPPSGPIALMGTTGTPGFRVDVRAVRNALMVVTFLFAAALFLQQARRRRSRFALQRPLMARFAPIVLLAFTWSAAGCDGAAAVESSTEALIGGTQTEPLGTLYYHSNHLGSAALVTDQTGAEVARLTYAPYGGIDPLASGRLLPDGTFDTQVKMTPVGFTGQPMDREARLYQMGVRSYDPALGMFLTPDTMVPDLGSTQGLSLYAYAHGNPLSYSDPSGHLAWFVPALVAFGVGFIMGGTKGNPFSLDNWGDFDLVNAFKWGTIAGLATLGYSALGLVPSVGPLPVGGMLQGGYLNSLMSFAKGERDPLTLAQHFGVGAIEAGVYKSGWWRKGLTGFLLSDILTRPIVSALDPDRGLEIGFGIGYYNTASDSTYFAWGRMFHLGLSLGAERLARLLGNDAPWQRITKYANLGVFSMSLDETLVTEIRAAADFAGDNYGRVDPETGPSDGVRKALTRKGLLAYFGTRLTLAALAVSGVALGSWIADNNYFWPVIVPAG